MAISLIRARMPVTPDAARRHDLRLSATAIVLKVDLREFAAMYPPVDPQPRPGDPADVTRRLDASDGVMLMPCAPQMQPSSVPGRPDGRHLWVIDAESVPVILETAQAVKPPPLANGVAKHTNLTGGDPACCGGEVWRDEVHSTRLYVNGGSGRYPAKSARQLEDAVDVFRSFGYIVRSAGWSYENDCPERVFR